MQDGIRVRLLGKVHLSRDLFKQNHWQIVINILQLNRLKYFRVLIKFHHFAYIKKRNML